VRLYLLLSLAIERMRKDLHAAVQVQAALLPTSMPNLADVQLAWLCQPCEQLGGDTLNVFRLDEQHLGLFVLDVSGHGVSSALLAVQVSRVLNPLIVAGALLKRATAKPPGYLINPPLQVVRELNDLFPMNVQTNQYFTILYGLYHLPSHTLRYASAGHPGPLIVRAQGVVERQDVTGNPIGLFPAHEAYFNEYSLQLGPGDRLYCFSDGVFETVNARQEVLGIQGLYQTLLAQRNAGLDASLRAVAGLLECWRAGVLPGDDVTMLALEHRG
jgi:sigma-B regulation protein RsbU (phosphoserine phosphatase)